MSTGGVGVGAGAGAGVGAGTGTGPTYTTLAPPGQSILTTIGNLWKSFTNFEVTTLAEGIGIFVTATQSVRVVASGVAAAAAQSVLNTVNAKYQGVPLSPAALATGIVRNVLPDSTGAAGTPPANYPKPLYSGVAGHSPTVEASYSGLDGNRFAALVGATGESYGILDALRLLNRNANLWALTKNNSTDPTAPRFTGTSDLGPAWGITDAEFAEVVAHSDIRPEYIPSLLKLRYNSVSPADAVEMVVKQIVDENTGQNLFADAGGFPEQFAALVAAAGDSVGQEKMVEMLAHGQISEQFARQMLGMSRVNPAFYDAYITASGGPGPVYAKWLAPYEISEAVKAGTVTPAQALTWLLDAGYDSQQASAFAAGLGAGAVAKPKEETEAMVLKEYQAQLLTEAEASAALANLGYTGAAIPFLLQYATATAINAARNSAVSRVRAAFLVGDITSSQAQTDLGELNIPQAAITAYLADWAVENATPHAHLSAAQVGKLHEEGILGTPTAVQKWMAMGYGSNDAVLLATYLYPPPAATTTPPVVA